MQLSTPSHLSDQIPDNKPPVPARILIYNFNEVRQFSLNLCQTLEAEDFVIQSMPDTSPTKWHLAHTTWFFETFVLTPLNNDYKPFNDQFFYIFNSYYNAVGPAFTRANRGLLARPTVKEIFAYRAYVDQKMVALLSKMSQDEIESVEDVITIGLNHEQQHQELLLTDIKHVFASNPLMPVFKPADYQPGKISPLVWKTFDEGIYNIGFEGEGFSFDNESPRHRVFLNEFKMASRLTTCGEYLEFMEDGGYEKSALWLSEGWYTVNKEKWDKPLYWFKKDDEWWIFTLSGPRKLDLAEPVCHVSYFEADAFARWAKARLATEAEWEAAAAGRLVLGNFADSERFHPVALDFNDTDDNINQMFGDVWSWTSSPYTAYPGYKAEEGALGEYNGKFMVNQMVLRGGSCATSKNHIRKTYRNFFPTYARWQFSGIRLAMDV